MNSTEGKYPSDQFFHNIAINVNIKGSSYVVSHQLQSWQRGGKKFTKVAVVYSEILPKVKPTSKWIRDNNRLEKYREMSRNPLPNRPPNQSIPPRNGPSQQPQPSSQPIGNQPEIKRSSGGNGTNTFEPLEDDIDDSDDNNSDHDNMEDEKKFEVVAFQTKTNNHQTQTTTQRKQRGI